MDRIKTFGSLLTSIAGHSEYLEKEFEKVVIILNPFAGGFRKKRFLSSALEMLNLFAEKNSSGSAMKKGFSERIEIRHTVCPGHAAVVAGEILKKDEDKSLLIITAGGDGTAVEVCGAMAEARGGSRKAAVFRLPMGTGNDGLDSLTLAGAMEVLTGPVKIETLDGLKITPKNLPPLYSFNIASIGLDGWVVNLTNKLKKIIPGSFYSIMVDAATLFYEKSVGLTSMRLSGRRDGDVPFSMEGRYLLAAVGVSGERTYGGRKRILPGKENVCVVKGMSFSRKISVKNKFYTGDHVGLPEAVLFCSGELEIDYPGSLPLQYDGEGLQLHRENFPVQFTVLPAILRRVSSAR